MRHLLVLTLASFLALPAAAQYNVTTSAPAPTNPAPSIPSGPVHTDMPMMNTGPTGQQAPGTGQAVVGATGEKPKVEVGYDAKVKRDPYGNMIKDDKKAVETKVEEPVLRNDKKLTGDSALFKKP